MSNKEIGALYKSVMEDVLNSSRIDFEEAGIDESVLESLRKGWERKLTSTGVGHFPWDEPLEPEAPEDSATTPVDTTPVDVPMTSAASGLGPTYPDAPSAPLQGLSLPIMTIPNGVRIKREPGLELGMDSAPAIKLEDTGMPNLGSDPAHDRAKQLIRSQYGQEAVDGIRAQLQQNGGAGPGPVYPQQRVPPQSPPLGLQQAQTDGPVDGANVESGISETGNMNGGGLAEWERAKQKRMQGGGLMLPLVKAVRDKSLPVNRQGGASGIGAFDGEDEDGDEDVINSDLDDPESDRDDDEQNDNLMLCMYDKVQRVKNKWKCTLKDGTLTVNGHEYVFHKATGEFEW